MFKNLTIAFLLFTVMFAHGQVDPLKSNDSIAQMKWVDSLMKDMTIEQKVGQLFMIAAYSNKDQKHINFISSTIKEYEIGGLIFFQGTATEHAKLINKYQKLSKNPLLIGIDAEWGLDMRLKNMVQYPYNMALGAIRDDALLYEYGQQLAKDIKRVGMHINFAPSVDINTNPDNPVIGNRSFGEDKKNVTRKAAYFVKGMQSEEVLVSAKHFPGHGDTSQDSHKTLPTVDFDKKRMEDVELYPYKYLIDMGLTGVMVAHLSVPSLEPNPTLPTSLSKNVVTDLLKEKMAFNGLIYTDALNMKGASNFAKPGEIDLQAFLAGNDVLLFAESVPSALNKIKQAISNGKITEERLDYSVRKILKAKYWAGLNQYTPVDPTNIEEDLNSVERKVLNRKLVANAITLVKNDKNILPLKNLESNKIAYVKLGNYENEAFVNRLKDYTNVDVISDKNLDQVLGKLKKYQTVIVGFHTKGTSAYASYKFTSEQLHWLQEIARENTVVFDLFASPYSLLQLRTITNIDAIMVSYQNIESFQDISAQMIFGAMDIKGQLPVKIGNFFSAGYGLHSSSISRLAYSIPEDVGLSSEKLQKIDSVAKLVVDSSMAPGLQVLVARHGKVVYRKSFGYFTYDNKTKVDNNSIYDLASVTKILGGLPMIMKAEEEGKFTLETTLGDMMPVLKGSNKDTLTVKEALSHYAKIKPYITYYKGTIDSKSKRPLETYYHKEPSSKYSIKVADKMYLRNDFEDTIYEQIALAPQRKKLAYKYSGLPFYLFKGYLEESYNQPLDVLDDLNFYGPLGATTLTYNPLNKFSKSRIVPSEKDEFFRYQLLHGTVHDEGAAMMGGVSGNAGLFANSNDVAKMMQMYLQEGYYGGKTFLKPETINEFNFRYYEDKGIRRGLGFDKPQIDPEEKATCGCISFKSFGHSGYTGTYTFADPETEIVYVFLSNRVYPTRKNNKLGKENIRTKVQGLIQDAIIE